MIYLLSVLCFFVVLILFNEYYYHIVLRDEQEHKILKGLEGRYNQISFGSSYGLFGIDFSGDPYGYNFCIGGQFFYYTDKMLREYAPRCLEKGGIVYIVIADMVFAKVGKGLYKSDRYSLLLSRKSLGKEYSLYHYIKKRMPLFFYPGTWVDLARYIINKKNRKNNYYLTENSLSYKEILEQARKRCDSWRKQFGFESTQSDNIPYELEGVFIKTRSILSGMISFCLENQFKPVLVVTPLSQAMNECLSDSFINKMLYNNIEKANKQGVPLLDYRKDKRFQSISLYANNADFLNVRGRKEFTKVLISDVRKMNL